MKRILAASAALVAFAAIGAAQAADMPLKAPADPGWSWAGFYVGGNLGYSWGSSKSSESLYDATTGAVLDSAAGTFPINGIIGGGQLGYNFQVRNWVFGFEGDFQGSGQHGSTSFVCPGGTGLPPLPAGYNGTCAAGALLADPSLLGGAVTDTLTEKLNWFGTLRGRLGTTLSPNVLLYGTGGWALGGISATDTVSGINYTGSAFFPTVTAVTSQLSTNTTKGGWTAGGGLEAMLSRHWSAKIEYLYLDLGTISGTFVTPIVTPAGHFLAASYGSHITDNIVRVGINYHFY